MSVRETEIDGRRVRYIDEGEGPAVLLLHGWGAPAQTYRLIISHLSARHRVVAPDLPGFGGSQEPPADWGADDYADFALRLAAQLGLEKAVLIGHSNGGRIIIKLLSRPSIPLAVPKAVLIDAAGIKPRHGAKYYAKVYSYKAGKRLLTLPGVRRLFPGAAERLKSRSGSADYRNASEVMRQVMVRCINEDLTPLLPLIRVPTLLIWRDNDTATPLTDGRLMEQRIPDAGLVVLRGGGHFSFADCWGQCRRVFDSFLG